MTLLIATSSEVLRLEAEGDTLLPCAGLEDRRPTCLAAAARAPGGAGGRATGRASGHAWCGTDGDGVFRSDDAGASWRAAGLADRRIMAVAASPGEEDVVWAGTEPSELWRSADGGTSWRRTPALEELPSSSEWAFPPRPETHHVRWIACHPTDPDRLWVAIEAGALVATTDGGRTWRDRVPGGPYDTHELAIHPAAPATLHVSAGDGYYQSHDGGDTWTAPREGFDVEYLRSVALDPADPDTVLVSAASHPHSAYGAGRSDGRLYRRAGDGPWERVTAGWPDPPRTIAPLLAAGERAGELWAADERGVHRSGDGGSSWQQIAGYPTPLRYLRGLVVAPGST
jgi:photosystem II stability/assembly factor-like uncharacterized protein